MTVRRDPDPECRTTVDRLRSWAARRPDDPALSEKRLGIWHDISWAEYWDTVQLVAHGLAGIGVGTQDRVAIHAENRAEWLFADLGAVAIRAVPLGIYPTSPAREVHHLLEDSGAQVLIAEDQEQVDKALEVAPSLPALRHIVYIEDRGLRSYDHELLISWRELLTIGHVHRSRHPDLLESVSSEVRPDDIAQMIYTSGTTGPPKGAMLTVANVDFTFRAVEAGSFANPPACQRDVILSYLPLCHIAERISSMFMNLSGGAVVHFAESIETVQRDLVDVQPTIFLAVPRIWEKIRSGVEIRSASSSRFKRSSLRLGMRLVTRAGNARAANEGRHTPASRAWYLASYPFVVRAVRDRIGLSRCRYALSGAAPIAPDLLRWLMGLGVPVHEVYGMTESTGIASANRPGRVRVGTVGEVDPAAELRIAEDTGEILIRHPGVFAGYWGQPGRTAEAVDEDGWLHTGDVGEIADGYLRIVDRIKDVIITAGGKNVSPSELETAVKASPVIREAIVVGDRKRYITALIGIELDTASEWAQRRGLAYTTYSDLSLKPEIMNLVRDEIRRANESFAQVERIKKFRMLTRELDHEDGDLTATQKVRRTAVLERFAHLVDDMYGDTEEFPGGDMVGINTATEAEAPSNHDRDVEAATS